MAKAVDRAELVQLTLATCMAEAFSLLPASMDSADARVLMISIGLQESEFTSRVQKLDGGRPGPAHGLWQFECGGGVKGVLEHPVTKGLAEQVCAKRSVKAVKEAVWLRLATDDVLAAAFARLLLYSDPNPLPCPGRPDMAWLYYLRNWRPGKPRQRDWPANYQLAVQAVGH